MHRFSRCLCLLGGLATVSTATNGTEPALTADDECLASESKESCSLNALQRRG
eukprot:CAMPEP_0171233012 /NCGR_PEP_ID=MMETSP0790-20130122/40702_1 /TAXON_ID=2925 /ORGANISM="Alexandrium catenella, Strain OF101" /LENGTH=52 /DNA_ID=CAMNT_0011699261 /DNA_START=26 /DNA_END=181 /DNA_ORIENTATION=+